VNPPYKVLYQFIDTADTENQQLSSTMFIPQRKKMILSRVQHIAGQTLLIGFLSGTAMLHRHA
jgi:hypothetical protein